MNVNVIAVGKLKEGYLREAAAEYIKRLGGLCRITVTELQDSKLPENPSEREIKSALSSEGERIRAALAARGGYNIAMCIEGKHISSEAFSEKLSSLALGGKSTVNFIIGSSYGIAEDIKSAADFRMSMSDMTFPHRLARIMLLEQIYRALSISVGKKYHK